MRTSLQKLCLSSLAIVFLFLCFLGQSWGQSMIQESDPSLTEEEALKKLIPTDSVITLTIRDAVMQALENNLDIQVSRFTRDVRLTDIVFQEAEFDPTVELGGRYDRRVIPLNRPILGLGGVAIGNDPDTLDQNDTGFNLGLTQKLITGGDFGLRFDTNRNSVAGPNAFLYNPSYTSNFLANLTQPLLRNFGHTINQTRVTIAKNSAAVEELSLTQQILSIISQVEQEYWELVFTRENFKVTKATLRAAEELLASNRGKVKAGVLAGSTSGTGRSG
jgi:outer membrane protein TolC